VTDLLRPAGALAVGPWAAYLTPEAAGWGYSGLGVADLAEGHSIRIETGGDEVIILPLAGSFDVSVDAFGAGGSPRTIRLAGRSSVWAGPTDFAYAPPATALTVSSAGGGRFAMPMARAEPGHPVRHVPAASVSVELRGSGASSREVRNFAAADAFAADRLIAVEVLTPGGNWGSYPPHKHDEIRDDETELEEIYHYIVANGPTGPGHAYQHVYGTSDRPIELLTTVRTGDTVLIPHGWHGPAMSPPGYDLYYLNVMAGPGERAWRACDDPAYGWVRETWVDQAIDPRLPFRRGT
jgi:5-deoxy-glucuronate isomerase